MKKKRSVLSALEADLPRPPKDGKTVVRRRMEHYHREQQQYALNLAAWKQGGGKGECPLVPSSETRERTRLM